MSTDARYHVREIEIDLADLPRWLYNEISSLHGHIDPPPANPVLTCLGNGAPMYIWHRGGRYFAKHYPGTKCGRAHSVRTMSDEHRRQAEYTARAAVDNDLDAQLEKPTGAGTRLDAAVIGRDQVGFEIQRSTLSRAKSKTRALTSYSAGWSTAWIHDTERDPDWAMHVPTARLTVRSDWTDHMPPRNTANAIIRRFWRERDRNSTSGWRFEHGPSTVLLDELSYLMPAGEIAPVSIRSMGLVLLAHKGANDIIDSCTYPRASQWIPDADTPRGEEDAQTVSRPCDRHQVNEVDVRNGEITCRGCGLGIDSRIGPPRYSWSQNGWVHSTGLKS